MTPTPEQLDTARAIIAFAEGKPVQYFSVTERWIDAATPSWNPEMKYRPKPALTLLAPPEGKRWQQGVELTKDMIPAGYRPLLEGEERKGGDEFYSGGKWIRITCDGDPVGRHQYPFRTRRDLPVEPKTRLWNCAGDLPSGPLWVRSAACPDLHMLVIVVWTAGITFTDNRMKGIHLHFGQTPERWAEREFSTDRLKWFNPQVPA